MTTEHTDEIWQPQPGEPQSWFERFDIYRQLGPWRSIAAAYRADAGAQANASGRPSRRWYVMAATWRWQARAEAWDALGYAERAAARAEEDMNRRLQRLERIEAEQRRDHVSTHLAAFDAALAAANLDQLDQATARKMVRELQRGLVQLMELERIEWGEDPQPRRRRRKAEAENSSVAFDRRTQAWLRKIERIYAKYAQSRAKESAEAAPSTPATES